MNIDDLQNNLDYIRAWRKLELSHARAIAERHRDTAEESYLCRVWTIMIYAHCDQSLKMIAKEYLQFLDFNPRASYNYDTVWIAFFGKEAIKQKSNDRFLLLHDASLESKKKN